MGDSKEFAALKRAWVVQVNDDVSAGNLAANAYRLAQTLRGYFNESRDGSAWPSARTLASRLGIHESTVFRLVRMLKNRGHLKIDCGGPGRGHSHRYHMILKPASAQVLEFPGKPAPAPLKPAPAPLKPAPAQVNLSRYESRYYARRDSEQLGAWDRHWRKTKGRDAPRDREGGWFFEKEWPPDYNSSVAETG